MQIRAMLRRKKIKWLFGLLFSVVVAIYSYDVNQRWNGRYSGPSLSPDGKYRIDQYILRQTGRYSSNSTVLELKVYGLGHSKGLNTDGLERKLLADYTREIYNGTSVELWDCDFENKSCKNFIFATGDGNYSISLPPPWYAQWLALLP